MKLTEKQRLILYRNITMFIFSILFWAWLIYEYLVKVGVIYVR